MTNDELRIANWKAADQAAIGVRGVFRRGGFGRMIGAFDWSGVMRIGVMLGVAMATAVMGACAPPRASDGGFGSPDPAARLYAIQRAGNDRDAASIPHLIEALDSDDMAVRMYAINALERITGDRMGYVYYEPANKRQAAVDRWAGAYESGKWSASATASGGGDAATSVNR